MLKPGGGASASCSVAASTSHDALLGNVGVSDVGLNNPFDGDKPGKPLIIPEDEDDNAVYNEIHFGDAGPLEYEYIDVHLESETDEMDISIANKSTFDSPLEDKNEPEKSTWTKWTPEALKSQKSAELTTPLSNKKASKTTLGDSVKKYSLDKIDLIAKEKVYFENEERRAQEKHDADQLRAKEKHEWEKVHYELTIEKLRHEINDIKKLSRMYDDFDFKSHFRLTRSSIEVLMCKIKPFYFPRMTEVGRSLVALEKSTLMTVWYMSNIETFRQVGDRFGLSRGLACRTIHKFIRALSKLLEEFVIWPMGSSATDTVQDFKNLRVNYMPNTIGCIDGCHIRMHASKSQRSDYTNQEMFQSIVLMAVCNSRLEFTYIFSGWPGSSHDAREFKNCSLGYKLLENPLEIVSKNHHLLGDSAFPLLENLLVPFKATHTLTDKEKQFNRRLSSTRVVIEQAFGLLFGRFRRLKYLESKSVELMVLTVTGACILHNLAIKNNDLMEIDECLTDIITLTEVHDSSISMAVTQRNGITKRNKLASWFCEK